MRITNKEIIDLLTEARMKGISVFLEKEKLRYTIDKNIRKESVDKDIISKLSEHKIAISGFLNSESGDFDLINTEKAKIIPFDRASFTRLPLSFSQERLLFIDRMEGTTQYHIPAVLRLKGKLNVNALEFALKNIVNRHEVLRTVIRDNDGLGFQFVKEKDSWKLEQIDGSVYKDNKAGLEKYINDTINSPFDLSEDHMMRGTLIKVNENEHILVITLHHIASDGWSISIIVKELVEYYKASEEKREAELTPLPIQYADFSMWQRNYLQGEVLEKKLGYWKDKLSDSEPLQLPLDFERPSVQSTKGAIASFSIDKDLSDSLNSLSKKNGVTFFMTLLSAFNVLLYRYSGQENFTIGSPIAGRQQEETEALIGFFINTLALRSEVTGTESFDELLQKIKTSTLGAYENQDVPFEKIVDSVVKQRDMSRSPVFQVTFALQNTPKVPELRLGDLILEGEDPKQNVSKFDLVFSISETENGLHGIVEYCTDLFKEETIIKMIAHFKNILTSVVKDPQQKTGSLQMLSREEEQKVVREFNETASEYPSEKSIMDLFEEQVKLSPDAPAVLFENEKLTYKELDERSNQVAHYLRSKEVEQGSLVPLCIERSAALMVGILGVLKAGCAYVPIDPEYPEERIRFMLKDTGSNIIISSRECIEKLPALEDYTKIEIDTDWKLISEQSKDKLSVEIKPDDLAYIIYTSGSTGWPKGVMVTQKNVVSLVKEVDYVTFTKDDVLLSTGSTSFDATTFEYWGMLLNGGKLVLCTENRLLDSEQLKQEINSRGVTKMWFTSSWFNQLVDNDITVFKNLKTILAGGEKLSEYHIEKMRQTYPEIEIINGYGPTENTTFSLTYNIKETDLTKQKILIPIGRPLSNRTAYVLNKNLQPVPIGITGEVFLGGDGVSNGYLNNPDLTKEKFLTDPFNNNPNARLYKTGDLGRWKADGNIEYLGRADEQVKIRGYRIELGEIENALQECELVKQAAVLVKQTAEGSKRLVGYVVPEGEYDKDEIVKYLNKRLPDHMVPAMWVKMDTLPLTKNGKVDRRALPEVDGSELLSKEYVAPRNEMESALAEIWKGLLHIDKVGIHDNFFELGGHSLLAMRVISSVRNDLGEELAIKDLFLNPNIADLAEHIETKKKKSLLPAIEVQTRPELIPLSFSQERLWFIDRLVGSVQYHLPAIIKLKGKLNIEALESALQRIINRHEVIRTVIQEIDGKGYQKIKDKDSWKLQITDDAKYKNSEDELRKFINDLVLAPFNLSEDHMLRCNLIRLKDEEFVLVMTMHHIASDGWSISIIVNELLEFYKAFEESREADLKPLQIQFADYAIWQKNYLQADVLTEKLDYWKKQLQSVEPLELPTDFTRPAVQSIRGAVYGFSIEKDLSEAIKKLSKDNGATLFMTLLAALNVMLYRYSRQNDISVGTPIAGRMQEETEDLIGFFINTLTLRNEVSDETAFTELLNNVKATTLEAYEHQDVPFEKVVETVVKQRDQSRSPLFQVMFVFQNTPEVKQLQLGEVELKIQEYEYTTSMFDFTLNMFETSEGLHGSFQYCTDLYKEESISRMVGHFKELLGSIVKAPEETAGMLPMLGETEKNLILSDFKGIETDYPKDKTIVDLFEEQVSKTPDNIALVFRNSSMTYKELNERSNKLAGYLISKGLKKEEFVPICLERGFDMIIGIFGILKAGGVYVPVDPDYPEDRISYVIEDTKANVVISSRECSSRILPNSKIEILKLDEDNSSLENLSDMNPEIKVEPKNLAYVIYTSGSTGKPKGVMVEHYNVVRLFMNDSPLFDFSEKDVWTMFHSFCFDFSVWEMYGALFFGGKLILVTKEQTKDASLYSDLIISENVTVMNQTPSAFYVLQESIISKAEKVSVRYVIFGGEALNPSKLLPWKQTFSECRLINMYGITETTVHVTFQEIGPEQLKSGSSIIGKPIPTLNSYILDSNHNIVPVGVPGEINVSGAGLARGYLNSEELTKKKFIKNPFSENGVERIYRSGDLGKWHPDGRMEYLGRIDEQVKIRGFRIELGEIENILQESGLVKSSVVLAKEDKHNIKRLIGYVVCKDSEKFDKQDIIAYLKSKLPEYMVPMLWVELETLPLTVNGKIDRKALPDPEVAEIAGNEYAAPTNEIEAALIGIWQELLNVNRIGINDNFFELGGHSLLALQLFGSIEKLSGRKFPISTLFNSPTIKELAEIIKDKGWVQPWKSLVPIKPGGSRLPLYCVPNAGGTALQFQELLKYVSSEQPIYVLESIGLDGVEKPHTDLREMSSFYIKEIQTFQPKGPYMLCGRCFGGRVAYEMAQQLMAAGEEVALLAIFDTWPPFVAPPPQHVPQKRDAQHFIKRSFYHLKSGKLFTVAKNYTVNKFIKIQRKIKETVGYIMSDSKQRRYEEIKLIHFKAQDEYVADKYPGKITLIECEAFKEETREKWKELAGGGLESYTIPGTDHKTIVTEPYIRYFAEKLDEVLKETDDEVKSRTNKNGSFPSLSKKKADFADV
jgi:amino acid adenylation domain-containing protein